MNDVGELKQYVIAHAHAQQIPRATYEKVLAGIGTDDDSPGSWAVEWTAAARAEEERGDLLRACRLYNIARFPYVDGSARREAAERSVQVFGRWAAEQPDIRPLELEVGGGRVRCWTTGLSASAPQPLLLVMGGIVSTKEQWAAILGPARKAGLAGIVAEMPGVGENGLPYDRQSPEFLSAILDAVEGQADVSRTYALAMSFSGHLALRCAVGDRRIKGIVTAGAPVADFFTDAGWQSRVPRITIDTLAHLTQVSADKLGDHLRDWALTAEELTALDIPVHYMASLRDEIIPPGEVPLLQKRLRRLRLLQVDDVHGSPRHTAEARLWSALSIQQVRGAGNAQTLALRGLLGLARARHRIRR